MDEKGINDVEEIGCIENCKTYTKHAMARAVGKSDRWVGKLLHEGLPHYNHGPVFISGRIFQVFVEEKSEVRKRVPLPGKS